jgi:hypothetical protein
MNHQHNKILMLERIKQYNSETSDYIAWQITMCLLDQFVETRPTRISSGNYDSTQHQAIGKDLCQAMIALHKHVYLSCLNGFYWLK